MTDDSTLQPQQQQPVLLSILELGGYPDFTKLYQSFGYQVQMIESMRKAIKFIKNNHLDLIVAEFNFQSDFRDRTSQLESLMASIAQKTDVKVIVFFDREQSMQLTRVTSRFEIFATLSYPIQAEELSSILSGI